MQTTFFLHFRWAALAVPLLFALFGGLACGPGVVTGGGGDGSGCTYEGETYSAGETFSAGCGACECLENGEVECGEIYCFGCEWEGVSYDHGETFTAANGCTCTCDNHDVYCGQSGCVLCEHNGSIYEPGMVFEADDGCNTCECLEDGSISCTEEACPQPDCSYEGYFHPSGETWKSNDQCLSCTCLAQGEVVCSDNGPCETCFYAGLFHQSSESFPALDGCNTCSCAGGGGVSCTEIACPCDPANEWFRDYIGNAQECAAIDFDCVAPLTNFYNTCGCGCEQPAWCPQGFDCAPPSNCDVMQIQEICPFSVIGL